MVASTISRCGGSSATTWPALVLTIGGAGTLNGWWRLGEPSGLFADSAGSGLPGSPFDLLDDGTGSETRDVTGCIGASQDDGAWQINVKGNPAAYRRALPNAGGNVTPGTQVSLTVVGWVRPQQTLLTDPSWRGAIINNSGIIAGSPSYERGWSFELFWPGGTANPSLRFVRSNDSLNGGQVIASVAGLVPGTNYMCAATFDGSNIRLYLDGVLQATVADTLRGIPENNGLVLGYGVNGDCYSVLDECAIWSTVLTGAQLLQLWSAAQ
jgi:hypothetical protein